MPGFLINSSRNSSSRTHAVAAPEQLDVKYEKTFPLDSDNNVQVLLLQVMYSTPPSLIALTSCLTIPSKYRASAKMFCYLTYDLG